jgi:hypothetical protein
MLEILREAGLVTQLGMTKSAQINMAHETSMEDFRAAPSTLLATLPLIAFGQTRSQRKYRKA